MKRYDCRIGLEMSSELKRDLQEFAKKNKIGISKAVREILKQVLWGYSDNEIDLGEEHNGK